MDETWIHMYDPETKEQSKGWRHNGSPCPKKFKTQKLSSKILESVFWDKNGIIFVDYLERGAKYYVALLDKLKQQLVSKHQGKFLKDSCFFKTAPPLRKRPLCTRKWQIFTLKF
jgi:hypothetical protein